MKGNTDDTKVIRKSTSLNTLSDINSPNSKHSSNSSNNSIHSPSSSFHSPNSINSSNSFSNVNSPIGLNSSLNAKSIKNNVGSNTIKSIGGSSKILPPLPLQEFCIDKNIHAISISGVKLKHINHNINENDKEDDFYDESECTVEGNLHDPFVSKKLSKYFMYIEKMEGKLFDELKKYMVYISPSFGLNNSDNNDKIKMVDKQSSVNIPCLIFDSEFECGNIDTVQLVEGRDHNIMEKHLEKGSKERDIQIPVEVQQEYDLTIRNDINTTGNIQWYYFSINTGHACNADSKKWSYPYKVRLNIINFTKSDSLYNYGMRPVVFSSRNHEKLGKSWSHDDTSDICYYQNRLIQNSGKGNKKQYTLTFTYTINGPDLVYFAHSYPYTYSDHLKYMALLEEDKIISKFMRRSLLCNTLLGNRCDLITITNRGSSIEEIKERSAIVLSARVHPGESNSSFIMHGLIKFLTSQDPAAIALRNNFVFKIVPMLNPDGVIHGNYRCSMMGTDLNRRYKDVHPLFYPTISSLKSILKSTHEDRCVLLYLDIHGHSKKKNAFVYGCDVTLQSGNTSRVSAVSLSNEEKMMQRIYTRIFPTILSSISNKDGGGYFSSADNSYKVQKSKKGTARIVAWRDIGIEGTYTIEASFCSNGDNSERRDIKYAFKNEMFRADDDDVYSVNITDDKAVFFRADAESIRLGYQHSRHYTRNDYINMGRDIGLAIFRFANLETGAEYSSSSGNPLDMDALEEVSRQTNVEYKEQDYNVGYLQRISYNNHEKSTRPMLRPAIFSSDAIMNLSRNSTIFQRCMRLQTEVYLRNVIGNPDKNIIISNQSFTNMIDNKFGKLDLEIEGDEDDGSDSDPSVDNMDQKDLTSSKNMKKMKSMSNILKVFIKSTTSRLGQERDNESTDASTSSSQTDTSKSKKSSKIAVRPLNKRVVPRRSYQFKSINPSQEIDESLKSESTELNAVLSSRTKERNSPSPVFDYEELHWSEKHYNAYKAQIKADQQKPVEKSLEYSSFPVSSASFGNMRDSLLFPEKLQKTTTGIASFTSSFQSAAPYSMRSFNNCYSNHQGNLFISQNNGYTISNDYSIPLKTIAPYKNSQSQKATPSIELYTKEKASISPVNSSQKSNSPVIEKTSHVSNVPVSVFETYSTNSIDSTYSSNSLKKDTSLKDFFRTMSTSSIPLPSSSTGPMENKVFIAANKTYDIDAPVPVPVGYQRKVKLTTHRS